MSNQTDTDADVVRPTRWMTLEEAGRHARVGRSTIENWIARGLPSHKPGGGVKARVLIDCAELDEWIRSRCFDRSAGAA